MGDTDQPAPPRRIILGAACYAEASIALPLAFALAERAGHGAELRAILVEEDSAAARPGAARIVTPSGTRRPAPSPEERRRALRADARAFEDALTRQARALHRGWSFERQRGITVLRLTGLAGAADILLLADHGLSRPAGPVLLIPDPAHLAGPGLDSALTLARRLGTGLEVCALRGPPAGGAVLDSLAALPRAPGTATGWRRFADRAALLAHVNRASPVAVVADIAGGPFRSDAELGQLRAAARCPLALVGRA